MPNALAWLTGRDDLTGQPDPPFGIDSGRLLARSPLDLGVQNPVLAPYYPSPSERFSGWISDLLGAGPGASLAKQNFATGVPNLLQATPLGIGLSAADLLHAKAADDPAGVAAAAIGMVPGVGGEARAAKNLIPWQNETEKALKMIEHVLEGKPAPQFQPKPLGAKPPQDTDVALSAIEDALNSPDIAKTFASTGPTAASKGTPMSDLEPMDQKKSWMHPEDMVYKEGQWWQKKGLPNTTKAEAAALPSKDGYTLFSAASKNVPGSEKDYFVHDPAGNKIGSLTYFPEKDSMPAQWQFSAHGVAPKYNTSLEELMHYIPGWHKQSLPASTTGAKSPIYDYEKDDNGLYHIFDVTSGKTKAVKDTELMAKSWINEQKAKSLGMTLVKNPFTVQENLGGSYDIIHSGTGNTYDVGFKSKMEAENKAKELFNKSQSGVKTIPITESKSSAAKPFDEVANKDYPQLPNYWKPNPAFDSKVTGLIRKDFSPVDWKNYTPPNARNEAVTPKLAVDPSHVESLGGNSKLALWKGGSIAGYPQELPDMVSKVAPNSGEPAKEKFEKAFFLADRPSVADSYIVGHDKGPAPYVALPKNVVETDWTDLAKKFKQYAPQATSAAHYSPVLMKYIIDAAREHGADMAIVHNIHDIGGPQTQYVVLNTNALRAPTAKFDPSKLHLRYPLAGLAGAGIYTAAEEGEEKQ